VDLDGDPAARPPVPPHVAVWRSVRAQELVHDLGVAYTRADSRNGCTHMSPFWVPGSASWTSLYAAVPAQYVAGSAGMPAGWDEPGGHGLAGREMACVPAAGVGGARFRRRVAGAAA
jgi:hypothetical protein